MNRLISALVAVLIGCGPLMAQADWTIEEKKINFLLQSIEQSPALFIRGGKEYDGKKAADHLRSKLNMALKDHDAETVTVDLFIEEIASKSILTGKAYQIRLPDGTVISAHDWLYQLLAFGQANHSIP